LYVTPYTLVFGQAAHTTWAKYVFGESFGRYTSPNESVEAPVAVAATVLV